MDHQIGNPFGLTVPDGNNRSGALTDTDLASVSAMKTRLQAVDSGYYTDNFLNTMTFNDLVFAVRDVEGEDEEA